ncbi:MAG TPA: ABC transporter permease [Flavitalea sp.]|nr:ABC transporter permease [Flavitalea sp.]
MSSLIRTEWLKLKKYRAFWWMTGLVALAYPGINYMFYQGAYKEQLDNKDFGPILKMLPNPFTFPEVWHTVAYISSFFLFIPSVVVIMFITNEYTYKTHRQNIIDGWSRKQFMIAKMTDVLLVSLLVTILYTLVAIIIGSVAGESTGSAWEETKYIALFFLQTFSQLSLAFLVAFLVRKAFIALGIFLFYFFPFEPIIVEIAKHKWNDIGRFMPLEISDRIISFPRFMIRRQEDWDHAVSQMNIHVVYTIILIGITWGLCFWLNSKRDL